MKRLTIVFVFAIFGTVQLFAQNPSPSPTVYREKVTTGNKSVPNQLNGGVLNGKATYLAKPKFPAAARAVNESGSVCVQVLFEVEGNVRSATAVSGHPLLRAAAVEAARVAKFAPTRLSGNPVKVYGVITYNFVASLYPARLGFILSHAERTGMFGKYGGAESIASQLPSDWVEEKEAFRGLTFDNSVTSSVSSGEPSKSVDAEPAKKDGDRITIKDDDNFSTASFGSSYVDRRLDAGSVTSIQGLTKMVEKRTAVNPQAAWNYQVGEALGRLVAELDDRSKIAANVADIDALLLRFPIQANLQAVEQLRDLVKLAKTEGLSAEQIEEIRRRAEGLSNFRY